MTTPTTPQTSGGFPPHWFTIFRQGTILGATLQPCTCVVPASSWRLFPDSLRVSDLIPILESLAHEPSHCSLVLCYVDSIDSAHYLMEAARVALAAFDDVTRERLLAPAPVPPGEAEKPREPLPEGHPDSFPMDELRRQLGDGDSRDLSFGRHYMKCAVCNGRGQTAEGGTCPVCRGIGLQDAKP